MPVRLRTEIARIERIAATYVKKKRDEANDQDSTDEIFASRCADAEQVLQSLMTSKTTARQANFRTLYNQLWIYRK